MSTFRKVALTTYLNPTLLEDLIGVLVAHYTKTNAACLALPFRFVEEPSDRSDNAGTWRTVKAKALADDGHYYEFTVTWRFGSVVDVAVTPLK